MPCTFVKGDMFETPGLKAVAHGCNTSGTMGRGVAKEVRARYPKLYDAYKQRCDDKLFNLGDVFPWVEGGFTVYNLGTQKSWRHKAKLDAIETALKGMVAHAEKAGTTKIGLPRIGAGLGGLPWSEVRDLMVQVGGTTKIELVVFEEFVAKAAK